MKKIKILDDLESMRATALLYDINYTMFDMFGYIYNEDRFSENNGNYIIDGYSFAKESCEIIEIDDRPILSGEQPEFAYYELSDDKEHWTQEAYLILGYDEAAPDPYFNGEEWYAYARKVEL